MRCAGNNGNTNHRKSKGAPGDDNDRDIFFRTESPEFYFRGSLDHPRDVLTGNHGGNWRGMDPEIHDSEGLNNTLRAGTATLSHAALRERWACDSAAHGHFRETSGHSDPGDFNSFMGAGSLSPIQNRQRYRQ